MPIHVTSKSKSIATNYVILYVITNINSKQPAVKPNKYLLFSGENNSKRKKKLNYKKASND